MKQLNVPQSGSQADTVASRNRFGQYLRTRAMPTQPRTVPQVTIRASLTAASQAWRGLSSSERAAWNAYAAVTPKADSLGQTVFLTGHQTFVGLWVLYDSLALTLPPNVPTDAPPTAPSFEVETLDDTPLVVLSYLGPPVTGGTFAVFASPPVSAGVTFNGDYRLISPWDATGSTDVDVTDAYVARFGAPGLGRQVFFQIKTVGITWGASAPTVLSGIVVSA